MTLARYVATALLLTGCVTRATNEPPVVPPAAPTPQTPAAPKAADSATVPKSAAFDLMICVDNVALLGRESPGLRYVTDFLVSILREMGAPPTRVKTGLCKTAPIKVTMCHGSPGRLACRADDVGSVLAQGYFWRRLAQTYPEATRQRQARLGSPAPSDAVASLVRSYVMRDEEALPTLSWLASDLGLAPQSLATLLREARAWLGEGGEPANESSSAAWLTGTFTLGHELYHVQSEQCGAAGIAFVERNGFWDYAVASMSNEELFCVTPPSPEELNADRCGLRRLAALRGNVSMQDALIAGEVIGWNIATGGDESRVASRDHAAAVRVEGYLNPALRLALVKDELSHLPTEGRSSRLCDRLARSAIVAIQKDVTACPGSHGNLDDTLLARLPLGVVPAFQGAPWKDPESFACPSE